MADLTLEKKTLNCTCGKPRNAHSRKRPGFIKHKFVKEKP